MHGASHQNSGHPMITEQMIRPLKAAGMTDMEVGTILGAKGSAIKHLRAKFGIPSIRPEGRNYPANGFNDGWPLVMSEEQRVKHWTQYFKKLGYDHSADDLRFPSTGRMMMQPDRSHCHGLGATSLTAMETF
jgi:hypothetical protein